MGASESARRLSRLYPPSELEHRLAQAVAGARRYGRTFGFLSVGFPSLSRMRDAFGPAFATELHAVATDRILGRVRETDVLARLRDDELGLLLTELRQPLDGARVAEALLAALCQPLEVFGSTDFFLPVSIGIATFRVDAEDSATLVENAQAARRYVDANRRGGYQFYSPKLNDEALRRLSLEGRLRGAVDRDEMVLHYQPQFDVAQGCVVGAEALLRWNDPRAGLLGPEAFLSVAEQCGVMGSLGAWVLREACAQLRAWRDAGHALRMAINVSPTQLADEGFCALVSDTLSECRLPGRLVELEITEMALVEDFHRTRRVLDALRARGVRFALDDFGVGYSSLLSLAELPCDTMKVEKTFVQALPVDPGRAAIVDSIVSLARGLSLSLVAEGVEEEEQLRMLVARGCRVIQGHLFGRAVPPRDFERRLQPT